MLGQKRIHIESTTNKCFYFQRKMLKLRSNFNDFFDEVMRMKELIQRKSSRIEVIDAEMKERRQTSEFPVHREQSSDSDDSVTAEREKLTVELSLHTQRFNESIEKLHKSKCETDFAVRAEHLHLLLITFDRVQWLQLIGEEQSFK